ncbi:MAG: transaldolase [Aeromonas sp.]
MQDLLSQLKTMTTVVADSGDIAAIKRFAPTDATTNPSLILKAAQIPAYAPLLDDALAWGANTSADPEQQLAAAADKLAVNIGVEVLKMVPGRISTEVDARLSFDTAASISKARQLIALYAAAGIGRERILIKLAATWEGIAAAKVLEAEGIQCNLTLLFSQAQARACAEAGVYLISPFVGRILDWHQAKTGQAYSASDDPGVQSVSAIYAYYKRYGYATIVMGASFRNCGEILALAGCDRLTIAPALLDELASQTGTLARQLTPATRHTDRPAPLTEAQFRWALNQDAMATEKLAEGIRQFAVDQAQLESLLRQQQLATTPAAFATR